MAVTGDSAPQVREKFSDLNWRVLRGESIGSVASLIRNLGAADVDALDGGKAYSVDPLEKRLELALVSYSAALEQRPSQAELFAWAGAELLEAASTRLGLEADYDSPDYVALKPASASLVDGAPNLAEFDYLLSVDAETRVAETTDWAEARTNDYFDTFTQRYKTGVPEPKDFMLERVGARHRAGDGRHRADVRAASTGESGFSLTRLAAVRAALGLESLALEAAVAGRRPAGRHVADSRFNWRSLIPGRPSFLRSPSSLRRLLESVGVAVTVAVATVAGLVGARAGNSAHQSGPPTSRDNSVSSVSQNEGLSIFGPRAGESVEQQSPTSGLPASPASGGVTEMPVAAFGVPVLAPVAYTGRHAAGAPNHSIDFERSFGGHTKAVKALVSEGANEQSIRKILESYRKGEVGPALIQARDCLRWTGPHATPATNKLLLALAGDAEVVAAQTHNAELGEMATSTVVWLTGGRNADALSAEAQAYSPQPLSVGRAQVEDATLTQEP